MCILRTFRVEEKCGHVLRKIVSHRTVEPPLFPGALLALQIGKDDVRAKSQIRFFFTSLRGVLTCRKNKRDIFYTARTSVLIKKNSTN